MPRPFKAGIAHRSDAVPHADSPSLSMSTLPCLLSLGLGSSNGCRLFLPASFRTFASSLLARFMYLRLRLSILSIFLGLAFPSPSPSAPPSRMPRLTASVLASSSIIRLLTKSRNYVGNQKGNCRRFQAHSIQDKCMTKNVVMAMSIADSSPSQRFPFITAGLSPRRVGSGRLPPARSGLRRRGPGR